MSRPQSSSIKTECFLKDFLFPHIDAFSPSSFILISLRCLSVRIYLGSFQLFSVITTMRRTFWNMSPCSCVRASECLNRSGLAGLTLLVASALAPARLLCTVVPLAHSLLTGEESVRLLVPADLTIFLHPHCDFNLHFPCLVDRGIAQLFTVYRPFRFLLWIAIYILCFFHGLSSPCWVFNFTFIYLAA